MNLPKRKYRVIYADPPWNFSSKQLQKYSEGRFRSLNEVYETQTKHWIKNLPVKEISKKDCALFLWTTDAHLIEALEVIKSWGFKYKTIAFIWEKRSKNNKTVYNLGAWTLKSYEICLFATKGRMLQYKKINNIKQKVVAERTKHSKKPHKVRKNIELLFGKCSRIELFARKRYKGWDSWGNEV